MLLGFMKFSEEGIANNLDFDDTFKVFPPFQSSILSNLIEEMKELSNHDLLVQQVMVILHQSNTVAYDKGPPSDCVLGIYAFDRLPSASKLAIYTAMFQDSYHFPLRECNLDYLHSFI